MSTLLKKKESVLWDFSRNCGQPLIRAGHFSCRPILNIPQVWFLNSPIGHNTLTSMIRNLMESAGEDSAHYNNHSGRRTAVCRIMDATGNKEIAKKITRHRSDCVTAYYEIPEKTMKLTPQIFNEFDNRFWNHESEWKWACHLYSKEESNECRHWWRKQQNQDILYLSFQFWL